MDATIANRERINLENALKYKAASEKLKETLEAGIEAGILIDGKEVWAAATISESCYYKPWLEDAGNVRIDDIMYANEIMALTYPEFSKFVTNTTNLFRGCNKEVIDLSQYDFSNVWNASHMFEDCENAYAITPGNFSDKLERMQYIFNGCISLSHVDVSKIVTQNVEDVSFVFRGCKSLSKIDLSDWKTEKIKNMDYFMDNCEDLSFVNIDGWVLPSVETSKFVTGHCQSLNNEFKEKMYNFVSENNRDVWNFVNDSKKIEPKTKVTFGESFRKDNPEVNESFEINDNELLDEREDL